MEQHTNDVLPPVIDTNETHPDVRVVPQQPESLPVTEISANKAIETALSSSSGPIAAPDSYQSQPNTPLPSNATPTLTDELAADDIDLIEKEWVVKAKQIVLSTKDDPYSQTKEVSKIKSDYLKKRFNMDSKASS